MVTCSNSNNANRVIGVTGSSPVSPTISLQVFRPPFETGSIKLYKGYNARILKKRLKKCLKHLVVTKNFRNFALVKTNKQFFDLLVT